jgi:hypothetical protein
MNNQDEPMDQEAIYAIAHLAGQAASELKDLDKLALGSSPNMKGLQFEPQELIRQNFLPRMQPNGAHPASANYRMRAPQPGTAPRPQFQPPQHQPPQHPPQQMMQPPQQIMQPQPGQQTPQVFAGISSNISEAQISLLMEKLLRVERLLDSCVSGQERLQTTLDKSLEKLLQKKMKDIKITFKDDNTDSQQE